MHRSTNSISLQGYFGNLRAFISACCQICTAHAQKLLFLSLLSKDITIRFSDPDFLKQSSNLALRCLSRVFFTV